MLFLQQCGERKIAETISFHWILTNTCPQTEGIKWVNNVRWCFGRCYITMWAVLWKLIFIMRMRKKHWEKMDCGVLERATRLTLKMTEILWAAPSFRRLKYALLLLLCYLASYTGTPDHFSKVNWGRAQLPSTCMLCFCYLLVFAIRNDFSLTHLFPRLSPVLSVCISLIELSQD